MIDASMARDHAARSAMPGGTIIARMNSMKRVSLGAGAVLAASLAGCSSFGVDSLNPWSDPVERSRVVPADATVYVCDSDRRLVVRYLSNPGAAMIVFMEREFRLDPAPSTAGARYTNGVTTLQSTGDMVSLDEAGTTTYSNCRKAAN